MKPKIKTTADLESPWVRWFMYGATGSGKTHAAATFPDPFFIVPKNEMSVVTLRGRDIQYAEVSNRQEMDGTVKWLRAQYSKMMNAHAELRNDVSEEDLDAVAALFPWQTIVVESLSHYCELLVEDISRGGRERMDMQAWGLLSSHLRTVHAQLSDLDVHVVYTSLEAVDDSGNGKPLMIGKNAIMMPSACDVITYHEAPFVAKGKKPIFRTHFRQYGKYPARSRFKGMPDYLDDFAFTKVGKSLGLS